jgi:hypothetical protein
MTGLDTAIASLLASRTELLLSAIRAPNGVSGSGVTGASVGQTRRRQRHRRKPRFPASRARST